MNTDLLETMEKAASLLDCTLMDFSGQTIRSVLNDVERIGGVTVYWGCFSESTLNEIWEY